MASGNGQRHGLETGELGLSRKRKDRDVFAAHPDPDPISSPKAEPVPLPMPTPQQQQIQANGGAGGKLLAGYLAHEFLTKGTLFGRHWDPTAAATPLSPKERHGPPPLADHQQQQTPPEAEEKNPETAAYEEVAYLLKAEGAGIPGVVNPTQLVQWLRM